MFKSSSVKQPAVATDGGGLLALQKDSGLNEMAVQVLSILAAVPSIRSKYPMRLTPAEAALGG